MKKLFSLLALTAIICSANCSRIPENNDPVIGIWSKTTQPATNTTDKTSGSSVRQEWIFNDVYLGRYHKYVNNKITVLTDFKWSHNGDVYTISYPGTDFPDDIVTMGDSPEGIAILQKTKQILATRE